MSSEGEAKELVRQAVKANRYKRWFFALIVSLVIAFAYAFAVSGLFSGPVTGQEKAHVAVVRVNGPIMEDKEASAKSVIESLRNAIANEHSVGVILSINSPGGSPIQAERIYDEIQKTSREHKDKKIVAVINELGASAAYYIASGAPKIYSSKASLVGSIGVTGSGFGFTGVMDKLGVERRVYAAGEHKLFLDQFSAPNEQEAAFFKGVLGKVHEEFIDRVKRGRGDRLKWTEHPDVFSGLIWDGGTAKDIGLVDDIGTIDTVLEKEFGITDVYVYEEQKPLMKVLGGMIGASLYQNVMEDAGFSGVRM